MDLNDNENLINYVKKYKVPKKVPKLDNKHILLPIHNIKQNEPRVSKQNPNINPSNKVSIKNKHKSVGKPTIKKTTKSSKHKNKQTSTGVSFFPEDYKIENNNNRINIINLENETKPKKETKSKVKKKEDKDYKYDSRYE